ncbi:hypothetical protein BCR35DRAFT_302284 [Leucosporidium creatinivorum]|uniref:Secreted protein n=1 Tax=Leucosporidium creatinivorum TaxID=106004 RepID=A0A1Y2FWF4_9BASI|nr:hypothetical protein BCR35DRAFT_302284 [Leucosporidium creatinivorum]
MVPGLRKWDLIIILAAQLPLLGRLAPLGSPTRPHLNCDYISGCRRGYLIVSCRPCQVPPPPAQEEMRASRAIKSATRARASSSASRENRPATGTQQDPRIVRRWRRLLGRPSRFQRLHRTRQ